MQSFFSLSTLIPFSKQRRESLATIVLCALSCLWAPNSETDSCQDVVDAHVRGRRSTSVNTSLTGLLIRIFKGFDTRDSTRQQYAEIVVNSLKTNILSLSDSDFRGRIDALKQRALNMQGDSMDSLLPLLSSILRLTLMFFCFNCFILISGSVYCCKRSFHKSFGLRPFIEQLIGKKNLCRYSLFQLLSQLCQHLLFQDWLKRLRRSRYGGSKLMEIRQCKNTRVRSGYK